MEKFYEKLIEIEIRQLDRYFYNPEVDKIKQFLDISNNR
jgi:hypothetical protein